MRYLANLRLFFSRTPGHLRRAAERADSKGFTGLGACYRRKCAEEQGHHLWASEDLAHLDGPARGMAHGIAPSMVRLIDYVETVVTEDPRSYLAVTFLHEYLTVYLGPRWVRVLVEDCGVDPSGLTSVTKHIALDEAHAEQGVEEIDALVEDADQWSRFGKTLNRTMVLVDAWLGEIVELHDSAGTNGQS